MTIEPKLARVEAAVFEKVPIASLLKMETDIKLLGTSSAMATPKPGILLQDTDERSAILIHPAKDYLWSIGCLNPGFNLTNANSSIEFKDSRARVIAIIEAMKAKIGTGFPSRGEATIPNAIIMIVGEPS